MKPNYFIKTAALLGLAVVVLSSGCNKKPGSWKNGQIDAGKKKDLHAMHDGVMDDIRKDDQKHLENIMSAEVLNNPGTMRTVDNISNDLKSGKSELLDEYYIVNKYRDRDTIINKDHGINNYTIDYPGVAQEMYINISVITSPSEKRLVMAAYSKYNYGWKLSRLSVNTFALNGMTAPELYQLAKDQYQKKYLVDAVNTMGLAYACLTPVEIWQYPQHEEIMKFYQQIVGEAERKFGKGLVFSDIPTNPFVFRIANKQFTDGVYYPAVFYHSKVSLKDTTALKKENMQMRKSIGKLITGIDVGKKYLIYVAYNRPPSAKESVETYEFDQELK